MTDITIISLVLAALGAIAIFIPVVPAVLFSYAALICAHFAGASYINANILIFWGIASLIIIGLRFLQRDYARTTKGNAYVAAGALIGTLLAYFISSMSASYIIGGAVGSFLGALAYVRLLGVPSFSITSRRFIDYVCVKGLSDTVTLSMSMIVFICLL